MLYLKVNSCMIKGIGGQPYIALDEHIDIEGFRNLHPEICRGFALAREYAKEGTWMSPGFDPKDMSYQLNWKPKITFEKGLKETILWYLNNKKFLKSIAKKNYEKSFKIYSRG